MSGGGSPKGLYRASGISLILIAVVVAISTVIAFATPSTPFSPEKALTSYPSQAALFFATNAMGVLIGVLGFVGVVGLYASLRETNPGFSLVGTVFGAAAFTVTLVSTAMTLATPALYDSYASSAATAGDKAAFVAAYETISQASSAIGGVSFVLLGVFALIVSWVMLKGVFSKGVAYLGFAVFVVVSVLVASGPFPAAGFVGFIGYVALVVLIAAFSAAVGVKLFRLGSAK
ncbi:MAG: hypothetical protein OK422_00075 [Thaumarchaeota archaeon]|nr:hypothetical protein [Nitrososphaerota archaeon]